MYQNADMYFYEIDILQYNYVHKRLRLSDKGYVRNKQQWIWFLFI